MLVWVSNGYPDYVRMDASLAMVVGSQVIVVSAGILPERHTR
jgi:hypothetical protein